MLKQFAVVVAVLTGLAGLAQATEICGDGLDNDGNGLVDEGCTTTVCESPLSCGKTGMVSPLKGALTYKLPPDINPKVPYGPGIGFTRTYQSQAVPGGSAPAYRKALGDRWTHTYATWLDKFTGTPNYVVLHLSEGKDTLIKLTSTTGGWDKYQTFQPGFHVQYLQQRQAAPNESRTPSARAAAAPSPPSTKSSSWRWRSQARCSAR